MNMDQAQVTTPPPLSAPVPHPAQSPAPTIAPPPLSAGNSSAIETNNLTKRYGALTALDNLSLRLDQGDVFGFIGPNGAGKSTTMRILAGLLTPTAGFATVLRKNVTTNGEFIRRSV